MFTTISFLVSRLPELEDRRAWEVFEDRYTPVLRRYFRKSACGVELARDLAQETMQRVADGLRRGTFKHDQGRLRNWIGGIARNVLRGHWRYQREHAAGTQLQTQFWETQADPTAGEAVVAADGRFDAIWVRARLSALLRLAAQTIAQRDLRCYFIVEIRKLAIREVAHRTGLSEAAVFQKRRQVANWLHAVGPRFISRWEQ